MRYLHEFKQSLLNKYKSKYIRTMIENSPIFCDETTQIYQGLISGKWSLNGFVGGLLEGRIGEINFGENTFFGEVFRYKGDKNLYNFTNSDNKEYLGIDFVSDFGMAVDVKMIGPTAIRKAHFASGKVHKECAFNKKDIDKYMKTSSWPFLLIYSDLTFDNSRHEMFVDLKKCFDLQDRLDTLHSFMIDPSTGREVYRINVEYNYIYNYTNHFLMTTEEFARLVIEEYTKKVNANKAEFYDAFAVCAGYA